MSFWYCKSILSYFLIPLSVFYRMVVYCRRLFYKIQFLKTHHLSVPVIVVGNITVGGTGKTPLVIALAQALEKQGFYPGIITRGYCGKNKTWPCVVDANSDPALVGDEAVLLAKKTNLPVMAGPNRVKSAELLIEKHGCNIIISDDGMQHYALARDIEIAVIDGTRRLGNGFCLPAGPLREPVSRLKTVDFVVTNGVAHSGEYAMTFVIDDIVNLLDNNKRLSIDDCRNKTMIAIAAIGNPDRFFSLLQEKNFVFEKKQFRDHYFFEANDFNLLPYDLIVMTEKDAVKCSAFADSRYYVARGHAEISEMLLVAIIQEFRTSCVTPSFAVSLPKISRFS